MYNPIRATKSWWNHKRRSTRLAIKMLIWLNLILAFIVFYGGSIVYRELSEPIVPAMAQYEKTMGEKIEPMPTEVLDVLNFYSDLFGVDRNLVYKIVECESNFQIDRNGDKQASLTSRGLWQFQPLTFFQYAKKYGVKNADINDYRDQTIIAIQILRDGKRAEWTCGR